MSSGPNAIAVNVCDNLAIIDIRDNLVVRRTYATQSHRINTNKISESKAKVSGSGLTLVNRPVQVQQCDATGNSTLKKDNSRLSLTRNR